MITYEEAKAKALKVNPKYDSVEEYKNAYVFYDSKAKGAEAEDNETVILKQSGNATSFISFITNFKGDKRIGNREI